VGIMIVPKGKIMNVLGGTATVPDSVNLNSQKIPIS